MLNVISENDDTSFISRFLCLMRRMTDIVILYDNVNVISDDTDMNSFVPIASMSQPDIMHGITSLTTHELILDSYARERLDE